MAELGRQDAVMEETDQSADKVHTPSGYRSRQVVLLTIGAIPSGPRDTFLLSYFY